MDFLIDLFLEWFSETFAGMIFARFFSYINDHIKVKWLRGSFITVSIIISCAIAVAIAFGIVVLIMLLIINIFKI